MEVMDFSFSPQKKYFYRKNYVLIIYDITDSESFLFSTKFLVKEIQPLQNKRDFFIIFN